MRMFDKKYAMKVRVNCQCFENYNTETITPARWKPKGCKVFAFDVDESEWTYGKDAVMLWFETTILPQYENLYFRFEAAEYEPEFSQPEYVGKFYND
jgi:hypothetical protein